MAQEYELVSHSRFRCLNIFLVRMLSRTPHIHRELEVGLILDGTVDLQTGTGKYTFEKGDIYLVNPLEAHEFAASGSGALILSIQLSARWVESFFTEQPNICFAGGPKIKEHYSGKQEQYDLLSFLCVELAYTYLAHQPNSEFKCFSLAAQLLCRLQSQVPNQVLSQQDYRPIQQKTDRILSVTDYIDEHFTQKLLLEDIAQREGISMMYLSHLFKEALGISFQGYLKQKRFEHACNLIATTGRSILDISISSGFSDVRYLTKLFRERFGCTPKEYRRDTANRPGRLTSSLESTEYIFTPQDGFLLLTPVRNRMKEALRPELTVTQWLAEP